jgi:hypothetical protein
MVGLINILLTEEDFSYDGPVFKRFSHVVRCFKTENGEMAVLYVVKNHGILKKLDM